MTSSMELMLTSIDIQNELIVTTLEMPTLMRKGSSSINILCILPILPIIPIVAHVIIASTQVKDLEIHVTLKAIPLVLFQIRVGAKVTMINIALHALKVFITPITILKDTHVVGKPKQEPSTLMNLLLKQVVIGPIDELDVGIE